MNIKANRECKIAKIVSRKYMLRTEILYIFQRFVVLCVVLETSEELRIHE
jgi:hypothetical protein